MSKIELSLFGTRLSEGSGILDLMNDIGDAVALHPDILTLGGGNPAMIPEMQALWRAQTEAFLNDNDSFDKALVCYDAPQGDPRFLDAFSAVFRERFGLPIDASNVAATSGAQLGAFCLFNMLAGKTINGRNRKILIPLSPEYVGYADMGATADLFVARPGKISYPDPNDLSTFKYEVDFNAVERALETNDVAALLVTRPTNPSGNCITRDELVKLDALAERFGAYLIVDSAYGAPFPGIVEDESELDSVFWTPRTILIYSLSKIGLPGLRTGAVVAPSEIIERLSAITAIVGLANSSVGQRVATPLFASGEILTAARNIVRPYYCRRRADAIAQLKDALKRLGVDGRLHRSDGAFFLWLWTPDLKIGAKELYRRLKSKGALVIPGEDFFFGLDDLNDVERDPVFDASRSQTLRISFSAREEVVARGLTLIAETIAEAIDKG